MNLDLNQDFITGSILLKLKHNFREIKLQTNMATNRFTNSVLPEYQTLFSFQKIDQKVSTFCNSTSSLSMINSFQRDNSIKYLLENYLIVLSKFIWNQFKKWKGFCFPLLWLDIVTLIYVIQTTKTITKYELRKHTNFEPISWNVQRQQKLEQQK